MTAPFAFRLACAALLAVGLAGCHAEPTPVTVEPWPEATPESRGLDSVALAGIVTRVTAQATPVHHLLLAGNGAVLSRTTWFPYDSALPHDVASVTKSVTSLLVGIALDRGALQNLQQRVVDFFPDRPIAHLDVRKRAMTLEDLLTMRSGLACGLQPGEPELWQMLQAPDYLSFALDLPMATTPGTAFAYCSLNQHLLSGILTAATRQSLLDYADAHLFGPMGIHSAVWPADPQGLTHGWGDLQLAPDDLAKLGQLLLDDGVWHGQRLISHAWIAASQTAMVAADAGDDYALGWWLPHFPPGLVLAQGRGGQALAVWPEHHLVLVLLAGGADLGTLAAQLLPALADAPLPANPAGVALLADASRLAALPPTPVNPPPLPAVAAQMSGIDFALTANPLGLSQLRLEFADPREATLTWTRDSAPYVFAVGLDGVPRYAPNRLGQPAAVQGKWDGAKFIVVLDEVGLINRFVIQLAFAQTAEGMWQLSGDVAEQTSTLFPATAFTGTPAK